MKKSVVLQVLFSLILFINKAILTCNGINLSFITYKEITDSACNVSVEISNGTIGTEPRERIEVFLRSGKAALTEIVDIIAVFRKLLSANNPLIMIVGSRAYFSRNLRAVIAEELLKIRIAGTHIERRSNLRIQQVLLIVGIKLRKSRNGGRSLALHLRLTGIPSNNRTRLRQINKSI